MAYKGVSGKEEIRSSRRKRDSRRFGQKYQDFFKDYNSSTTFLIFYFGILVITGLIFRLPLIAELFLIIYILAIRKYFNFDKQSFSFPFRIPKLANILDASYDKPKLGEGITYLGNEKGSKLQIFSSTRDLSAHMLVLGTTGSGKTQFLLGLIANALVQNTGALYIDGKGGINLIADVFRLTRRVGREDDLCVINFITSGRDFIDKQTDKITNTINLMATTSSGMLIETIVGLMDDSGGSGNDMWKGRAIAFVAALTRPLCYLRDKGFLSLSAETYLYYFELTNLEILLYEPEKLYPQLNKQEFENILGALKAYIINLPGYNGSLFKENKQQEQKTLEQHGFITMQLTRIFNDLTYNFGHIFHNDVGDVDFFDIVLNRRILVVLLPSSERSPDSLRMLGKLVLGNIKQMLAGCLGNRIEGQTRTLLTNGPSSSPIPFYMILDEYGYYTVVGFANIAAQARSAGFSITFAAQDFSSLKRSNAEEADSTWENTNMRIIGRITSGTESETWRRISGAAGTAYIANLAAFNRESGFVSDKLYASDNVSITNVNRLEYDDLASQELGEFTYLIGKKNEKGLDSGVRVIRGMGFYTDSKPSKEIRLNDLIPVRRPQKNEIQDISKAVSGAVERVGSTYVDTRLTSVQFCKSNNPLTAIMEIYEYMNQSENIPRQQQSLAILYWLLKKLDQPKEIGNGKSHLYETADISINSDKTSTMRDFFNKIISGAIEVKKLDKSEQDIVDGNNKIDINDNEIQETYFASKDENEVINVIDPLRISNAKIDDSYTELEKIELFKFLQTDLLDENEISSRETINDLASKDQVRALHILCDNKGDESRPYFEVADKNYDLINKTLKQQTTYSVNKSLENNLSDLEDAISKLELLSNTLNKVTNKN